MKFLLCLIFFSSVLSGYSQTHEVIYFKGNIKNQKTGKLLKKGSQFKKRDKLEFAQMKNWLITLETSTKKNYIVRSQKNRANQIITTFQLVPYKIQNRPGYILSGVDLVNYLNEGHQYLVIGKETHIPVNPNGFTMNQDTFFYLNYDYLGFSINKKLPLTKEGIVLNKDSLFQVRFTKAEYYRQILKDKDWDGINAKQDTFLQIAPDKLTLQKQQYVTFKDFKMDTITYWTNVALYYFDGKKDIPIEAPANPETSTLKYRDFLPFHLVFLEDAVVKEALAPLLESGLLKKRPDMIERLAAFLKKRFDGELEEGELEKWLEEQGELEGF